MQVAAHAAESIAKRSARSSGTSRTSPGVGRGDRLSALRVLRFGVIGGQHGAPARPAWTGTETAVLSSGYVPGAPAHCSGPIVLAVGHAPPDRAVHSVGGVVSSNLELPCSGATCGHSTFGAKLIVVRIVVQTTVSWCEIWGFCTFSRNYLCW
jgi:hypothetical protein